MLYDSIITLLHDGDFAARDKLRSMFSIRDLEILAKEKAAVRAATDSEEIR